MNITKIEGIGPHYASKLEGAGITTTASLLASAADRKGRLQLADRTGISMNQILGWVNRADLMRVRGIGQEYSDLLEAAGVDTARELSRRRPENLHQTLVITNASKKLVRRPPSLNEIQRWVEHAKMLPPMVTY